MKKSILKRLIPPIILDSLKNPDPYGYFGNYKNWQDALKNSVGYDSEIILEKVKDSLLKIKNGEAVYERDSKLFDKVEYSWPVLASLLWIASLHNNKLDLIDFGGSLGSSYFQNRSFLKHTKLSWNVVEQENFVKCGREFFEDNILKFFDTVEQIKNPENHVFFASSSLQYIESPYSFVENIIKKGFPYIIIDRTAFIKNSERITIQKIRPDIYKASYPAWFIDESKFLKLFEKDYDMIADFKSIGAQKINLGDKEGYLHGFIFKKK